MDTDRSSPSLPADWLVGGGDMGGRVRAFDWSTTPLGALATWPESLRVAVGTCLSARVAMHVWWGPELIYVYNDAHAPILGKRHPVALGRPAARVWTDAWPVLGPEVDAVINRGESTWNERAHVVLERNGFAEDAWFTWSYSPIRDGAGRVAGLLCVATEETARVLAERARVARAAEDEERRAEVRARTILESISDAFFSLGRSWEFTYANAEAGRILGRPTADLIGKSIWAEYPGMVGSDFETVYRNAMDLRLGGIITRHYPDHDRWYEVHTHPSADGISVFFRDVSEAKRAELEARDVAERFERQSRLFDRIASATPDFMYTFSVEGRVLYANKSLLELWGRTFEDTVGKNFTELGYPDWHAEMHLREIRQVVETKQPFQGEVPFTGGSGISRIYDYIFTPVLGPDGQVEVIAGTTRDVTQRKQLEAERQALLDSERAARQEAERAGRMKDEFLATLSHEIRTPLNAILGWSQIMRSSPTEDDVATGLDVIERNARAQSQIVEDLLDMSRIISGKYRLDVKRVDVAAVVQAAVETARPTAQAKGVRLQSVVDAPPPVTVNGDAGRLQQVLWNLISNAIKFTPAGGLIDVSLRRVGGAIEIGVTDDGEGIKPEFLPFAFDRFRQADATTTRRHGGLGLGLSIVKQLVELHGGAVRVSSDGPGRGSAFVVTLPPLASPAPEAPVEPRAARPAPTTELSCETSARIAGVRVLVVDDEADARLLVERLLGNCGAQVTVTGSADEAVRLIAGGRFDVLVSDIGMPDEDGYSLLTRVRALPPDRGGRVPAVALTAYARAEDRVKTMTAGFLYHVAKPFEPDELVMIVSKLAGQERRAGG